MFKATCMFRPSQHLVKIRERLHCWLNKYEVKNHNLSLILKLWNQTINTDTTLHYNTCFGGFFHYIWLKLTTDGKLKSCHSPQPPPCDSIAIKNVAVYSFKIYVPLNHNPSSDYVLYKNYIVAFLCILDAQVYNFQDTGLPAVVCRLVLESQPELNCKSAGLIYTLAYFFKQ